MTLQERRMHVANYRVQADAAARLLAESLRTGKCPLCGGPIVANQLLPAVWQCSKLNNGCEYQAFVE